MKAIKLVLGDKDYRIKFIYAFIVVLIIAAFLMNFISFFGLLQGKILFTDIVNYNSLIFLIIFSFLAALSLTLHFYKSEKLKMNKTGKEKIGIAGAFLGIFTSACTICYPLILTLLGVPAALAILPFGGLEIQALSIMLLLLSVFFISRSIENCKECKA